MFCSIPIPLDRLQGLHASGVKIDTIITKDRDFSAAHAAAMHLHPHQRDARLAWLVEQGVDVNRNCRWGKVPIGTPLQGLLISGFIDSAIKAFE